VTCQDSPADLRHAAAAPRRRRRDRDRARLRRTAPAPTGHLRAFHDRRIPARWAARLRIPRPVASNGRPTARHPAGAVVCRGSCVPGRPGTRPFRRIRQHDDCRERWRRARRSFPHAPPRRIAEQPARQYCAAARAPAAAARPLVRRFISTLAPGDLDCAEQVPRLRSRATVCAALDGGRARRGRVRETRPQRRRCVRRRAVLLTAGGPARPDGCQHEWPRRGVLRGGRFEITATETALHATLDAVALDDRPRGVRGRLTGRTMRARQVRCSIFGPMRDLRGHVVASWPEGIDGATADLDGEVGGSAPPPRAGKRHPDAGTRRRLRVVGAAMCKSVDGGAGPESRPGCARRIRSR